MKLSTAMLAVVFSGSVMAGSEFDFDWNDKNDMRGAWEMCETTGFTGGECPKVYQKCWQPPMIYRKKHKTKTYCKDDSKFSVGESDKNRYLEEGQRRADEAADKQQ
jgi:hypothetical protein